MRLYRRIAVAGVLMASRKGLHSSQVTHLQPLCWSAQLWTFGVTENIQIIKESRAVIHSSLYTSVLAAVKNVCSITEGRLGAWEVEGSVRAEQSPHSAGGCRRVTGTSERLVPKVQLLSVMGPNLQSHRVSGKTLQPQKASRGTSWTVRLTVQQHHCFNRERKKRWWGCE